MKIATIIVAGTLVLTGCATGYQTSGCTGGQMPKWRSANVLEIQAAGNGYTSSSKLNKMALLRAAETAIEANYRYFIEVGSENTGSSSTVTMPSTETTTYTVFIQDEDGCTDTDKVIVFVDEGIHVFAPNIFSPNGDGENEFFFLQSDASVKQINLLQIFDRWDNLVYLGEQTPPHIPELGWDGNFLGKPMNPQVFVWKAEVLFVDGRKEVLYGDFTLVR